MRKIKALIIFANPEDTLPLNLSRERDIISEITKLPENKVAIDVTLVEAATVHDLHRKLLAEEFQIVHISSHGTSSGLLFEDDKRESHRVPQRPLSKLLSSCESLECVILNACHSINQGELVSLGIPYAVAMKSKLHDESAVEFSRGFYEAVAAGKSYERAYEHGCLNVEFRFPNTDFPPVFFAGDKMITRDTVLVEESEVDSPRLAKYRAPLGFLVIAAILLNGFFGYSFRTCEVGCAERDIYALLASLCYGILFSIGILTECAYRFDDYGWTVSKVTPLVFLLGFSSLFSGLVVADYFLGDGMMLAFAAGLFLLIVGGLMAALMASTVLPNNPVTAARFQTQPALAAFMKNIFLYFISTYSIFILLIYCLIFSQDEFAMSVGFPLAFGVLLLVIVLISYISTNYLSDNLLTKKEGVQYKYHGLFGSLLVLRAVFCFIAPFGSVVFYLIKSLEMASGLR